MSLHNGAVYERQGGIMSQSNLQMEQSLQRQKVGNRRTALRFDASAIPAFKSISQVGGPAVKLINISRRGALIEGREYMSPGSRIALQIITEEAANTVKGRIIRCWPESTKGQASYKLVIAFDEDFTLHLKALMKTP